jgi:hypothetical protein
LLQRREDELAGAEAGFDARRDAALLEHLRVHLGQQLALGEVERGDDDLGPRGRPRLTRVPRPGAASRKGGCDPDERVET